MSPLSFPFWDSSSTLSDKSLNAFLFYFDVDSFNISPPRSQYISSLSLYFRSIPTLSIKLLDPDIQLPTNASVSTAGYNLYRC